MSLLSRARVRVRAVPRPQRALVVVSVRYLTLDTSAPSSLAHAARLLFSVL